MVPRATPLVNALLLLTACAPDAPGGGGFTPSADPRPLAAPINDARTATSPAFTVRTNLNDLIAQGRVRPEYRLHLDDLADGSSGPFVPRKGEPALDLSPLGPALEKVDVDLDRGALFQAYVDDNVPAARWRSYGAAALTFDEIWSGNNGEPLCEEPAVLGSVKVDGETLEASYAMGAYASFLDGFEPFTESLPDTCQEALVDAEGDVAAAAQDARCADYAAEFFPDDSACAACLQGDAGDFPACVDAGECPEEAQVLAWIEYKDKRYTYPLAGAHLWACAPDLPVPAYVMGAFDAEGGIPTPFDHAALGAVCIPYWNDADNAPAYSCSIGNNGPDYGHALGRGMVGRVNYIRAQGDTTHPHNDRLWYASSVEVRGSVTVDYFWATNPGSGQISCPNRAVDEDGPYPDMFNEPFGIGYAQWGYNPYGLRPGGTDDENIDDTYAREWLATLTLKTATTRDGVPIQTYHVNDCAEDGWEGPLEDGRYYCHKLTEPSASRHGDNDAGMFSYIQSGDWEYVQQYPTPMATIGSTGLPDPDVPGGNVVLVAGTPALANDAWDACTWPTQFTPDLQDVPADVRDPEGPSHLIGDTWRFGYHDELDLRVVLHTDQARGYCPPEGFQEALTR